ncbi:hypothetical protein [Plesiomonas sp.]|uniref:hypothetical protein n=1 Tax=Plesiomonas sp. TaxID=2486279 RepID=UPI003F2F3BDE
MNLLDICKSVRRKKLAQEGSIEGTCREVALAIAYQATQQGLDVCICFGTYQAQPHYWIRHRDKIYDATASQFGVDDEVYVIEEVNGAGYKEEGHIYASGARLGPLLNT